VKDRPRAAPVALPETSPNCLFWLLIDENSERDARPRSFAHRRNRPDDHAAAAIAGKSNYRQLQSRHRRVKRPHLVRPLLGHVTRTLQPWLGHSTRCAITELAPTGSTTSGGTHDLARGRSRALLPILQRAGSRRPSNEMSDPFQKWTSRVPAGSERFRSTTSTCRRFQGILGMR
jgi:hypothetical protein